MKSKLLKNWKVDVVLLMLFMLVIVSFLHTETNLIGFAILDFNETDLTVENETFENITDFNVTNITIGNETFENVTDLNVTFDNVTEINISGELVEDFLIHEISEHRKKVTVNSAEALISVKIEESPADAIIVYKYEDNKKIVFEDVDLIDSDEDGQIDKLEWIGFENEIFEVFITILNVQSYPTVGGNWTVQFETKGEADLIITAFDQTTWSNENELEDLKFLEIKCGDDVLDYSWINDSVVIYNYSCSGTGFEISKVLTTGIHDLEFTFGSQKAYAHNLACGSTIDKDTTLDGDMNCSGTAITIGADNIILDCAGYTINYSIAGADLTHAVKNSGGYDNVTVKNCIIVEKNASGSSKYGIRFGNSENSTIQNNTVTTIGPSSNGINLGSSNKNIVTDNTVNATLAAGIYLGTSSNNNVTNNNVTSGSSSIHMKYSSHYNIVDNNTLWSTSYTIYIQTSSTHNTIQNNDITAFGAQHNALYINVGSNYTTAKNNILKTDLGFAIQGQPSFFVNITNNTANTGGGFYLIGLSNSNINNNTINASNAGADGIFIHGNADNNVINYNNIIDARDGITLASSAAGFPENNNLTGNILSDSIRYKFEIYAGVNGTWLIDQPIANYSFAGAGGIVNFKNSTAGEVKFLESISGTGFNLSDDIQISTNYTYVNSSKSGLNKSANLTFIGVSGITDPIPMRNGVICASSICSNVTNSTTTTFHFNVSGFTYYSVNTLCGATLTSSYTLTDDVTCEGTVIFIGANNAVLDCAGYDMTYGTAGTAGTYGIDNSGDYDNITIKNCNIIEGESGTSNKRAIDFGNTVNSTSMNNTITTIATGSHGIFFSTSSSSNRVLNNTVTTSGGTAYGVSLQTSNSNITGNIIHTNGSSSQGISITSSNTICFNNTITTEGTEAWAIKVFGSSNNNVSKNTINTTGTNSDAIYIGGNSDENTIWENTVIASGGDGIELRKVFANSPNNNNISKNVLNNVDDYDLRVGEATDITYLIDQTVTNYSFFSSGNIISFRNSSVGEIRYLSGVNGSGVNLSNNIKISANYTYVYSSKTGLNRSANLTFWGLSDITDPVSLRNGEVCASSICGNVTNSTTTTFHFNVSGFTYFSVRNKTTAPPITNLTSPADGYYTTSPHITFTCNATSSVGLDNITLYHNISGSWVANQTVDASGASKVTSFNVSNILNGFYSWNCLAYDVNAQFDWADSNWTFTVNNSYRAYEKLGIPTNPGDYGNESSESGYNNMNASNDNRWTTALADTEGQYDSQIFIFNITDDMSEVSNISLLNFTWEGYGEDTADYYTNISYFNWSSSAWVEVTNKDFTSSADDTLAGFVNSNVTDFVNSSTNEVAVLVTTRKSIFSGWCYQETANASHASDGDCTLNYSGNYRCEGPWPASYPCNNTYDGNWSSSGLVSGTNSAFLFINYSKPAGSTNTSLWRTKDYGGPLNLTIPENCWNQNPLMFQVDSTQTIVPVYVKWFCHNGTDWELLRTYTENFAIYEEAMWWNISSSPFLYTYQSEEYIFLLDFIPGATSKEKEYTSFTDITKTEITNNKIKLKITEELDETTYLDRIYLRVDEKEIVELSLINDADINLLKESDNDYLIMEQGDEYYLEFQAPKNYEKLEFVAEGYYIEHYRKKDSEDPHNSLNTDFVSLVVTEDDNAPSLTLDHPQNITYYSNTSISLNYTATDDTGLASVWYNLDGGSNTTLTANITFATSDGSHTLNIWANDTSNNINSTSVDFYVNVECNKTITSSYTMFKDIVCADTAIFIGANNVELDCAGYDMTYATSGTANTYGVDNNGDYDNITIKNCNITEGESGTSTKRGIDFGNTVNSTSMNNTITTIATGSHGIFFSTSSSSNRVLNNTITTSGGTAYGVSLESSNTNVTGNIIHTNGSSSQGISITTSSTICFNNTITTEGTEAWAIRLFSQASKNNNNVSKNTINTTGTNSDAIYIGGDSNNNVIYENTIIASGGDGIELRKVFANSPNNNNISKNVFNNVDDYDLRVGEATDITYLIDQTVTNYSFFSSGNLIYIENSSIGIIRFLSGVNGSGVNLGDDIQMSTNYTYINSSKTGLNRSANLTFWGLSDITNPIPLRNGEVCASTICSSVTNSTTTTFHFNVSGFTYYSVRNNTAPAQVTLSSPGDGSSTTDRTPTFTWDAAVDPDGDSVTYEINVDNDDDFESLAINVSSIDDVTYTSGSDLDVIDDVYFWRVRAFDGWDYGQWSDVWNFTLDSLVDITLINGTIEFGDVDRGVAYDTSDDNPVPLSVQNDGNALVNISVNASSLFNSASMPDSSYRAKADGITQSGQTNNFDWGNSSTEWFNMPELTPSVAIAGLKYKDATDDAELDIAINTPMDELEGNKSSEVLFLGELAE